MEKKRERKERQIHNSFHCFLCKYLESTFTAAVPTSLPILTVVFKNGSVLMTIS